MGAPLYNAIVQNVPGHGSVRGLLGRIWLDPCILDRRTKVLEGSDTDPHSSCATDLLSARHERDSRGLSKRWENLDARSARNAEKAVRLYTACTRISQSDAPRIRLQPLGMQPWLAFSGATKNSQFQAKSCKGGIKVHIPGAMVVHQSFNQWVRRVKLWRHWHPYSPGWLPRDPHRLLQR